MAEIRRLASELRALAEAGISVASELSLETVLQRLVEVAREQVNARYGAISIIGPDGQIEQFLTAGISEEERKRIGAIPRGRGLLGLILREGATLRIKDMSEDPRSYGFPPQHPEMRSLLGAPVVSGDRIVGNLYLTEKQGAEEFDERDEEIVRLLATQAAVAVRNAELYQSAMRRAEEWKALFELGREVAASPDLGALLSLIVSQARRLLHTDTAAMMLLTPDQEHLKLAAHEGLRGAGDKATPISEQGLVALALETKAPVTVLHHPTDERLQDRATALVKDEQLLSLICAPLPGKAGCLGALIVGNRRRTQFSEHDAELLEAFANWAAVAIETSQLYEKLESLARLEERDRIGMDLHDGVIQSIYAVGLRLEDASERLATEPSARLRPLLERAMDDLTGVIKDIRSYIFDLRPRVSEVGDLRTEIERLVEEWRVNSLIEAQLQINGDIAGLSENEELAVFHIAQEALNNIGRHSGATSAALLLSQDNGRLVLEVRDNGKGFDTQGDGPPEKQGLRNMRDRARSVGAQLSIDSTPGRGTTVRLELYPGERKG
jgi:signal transduction histidine kinase